MQRFGRIFIWAFAACSAVLCAMPAQAQSHYKLVKTIDLPGKGGHGDWVVFDPATDLIWLAQSPDHDVVVIDAKTHAVKAVIGGIEDANGIALSGQYAFIADQAANRLVVVDKQDFKQVASVDSGGKAPDGVAFDPRRDAVFVGNDDSNTETVFSGTPPFGRIADIALKPAHAKHGPDVNLYVDATDRIYQPVDNVVDVIDPDTRTVADVWDFHLHKDAKPMVYDSEAKHLIIGSRDGKMLIVDTSGKLLASIPFDGGKIDQTAIDVGARRAFLGDKSGSLEVIDLDTNQVIDHLPAEKDTHTLAVDTKNHQVFVYLGKSNVVRVYAPV
jgi:DNA-binding beta-propeller fold protein YncE